MTLSAIIVEIMVRIGVLDHPVARSSHSVPTPKGGGIGIIGAFLITVILMRSLAGLPLFDWTFLPMLTAVAGLAAFSWLDDMFSFAARYKLGAQFAAEALVAISASPSPFSACIGLFAAVFLTNAVNFMDGINGLASGSMCLMAVFLALFGVTPAVFIIFAVAVLAFLPSNFPKARIFMGDVGSQAGALLLAWGGMMSRGHVTWLLPMMSAGIAADVLFTLGRRTLGKEQLSQAHRSHLYQLAVRSGLKASIITLIHWAFVIEGAALFAFCPVMIGLTVIIATQIVWTFLIIQRARTHVPRPW